MQNNENNNGLMKTIIIFKIPLILIDYYLIINKKRTYNNVLVFDPFTCAHAIFYCRNFIYAPHKIN